jgi:hypothetical protein
MMAMPHGARRNAAHRVGPVEWCGPLELRRIILPRRFQVVDGDTVKFGPGS